MSNSKINRIQQKIKAAEILIEAELYLEAALLYWQASRDSIFCWLTNKKMEFNSTNEALMQILSMLDDKIGTRVIQIEIIGTLAEWDEFFEISEEQMVDFKNMCISVLKVLEYGNN